MDPAMEKDIRFCTSAEGHTLAYARTGQGPLLVIPPGWVSHLVHQWDLPGMRTFFARLARHHTLIFFDKHGTGLSDRNRTDFSLQEDVRDLEAVIQAAGLARLSLFAFSMAGATAIAYAARHPERVEKLVLYGTFATGADVADKAMQASIISLVRANWGIGANLLAWLFVPEESNDPDIGRKLSLFQRKAASAETAARLLELFYELDVAPLLPNLRMPVLVMHRQGDKAIPIDHGRRLAAGIPEARFLPLEGGIHFPWLGNTTDTLVPLMEFLQGKPLSEGEIQALQTEADDAGADPVVASLDAPPAAGPPQTPGAYRIVYTDLLANAPRIQQPTCRVGIAQIDMAADLLEPRGQGLFGLRAEGVPVMQRRIDVMIERAVRRRMDMLLFPEMTIDLHHPELAQLLFEAAKAFDLYIVPGGYHDPDTRTNVCPVIGPEGVLWEQEKHTPATIRLNGQRIREGILTRPQKNIVIANTRFGRVAVAICRDFLDMDLRVELKNFSPPVDIVLNPALTPVTEDFAAAHLEARRSVYAYFFFCNVAAFGHSLIHSPEKERKRRGIPPHKESLIFKDIDLFNLRVERRKWEKERQERVRFIQSTR